MKDSLRGALAIGAVLALAGCAEEADSPAEPSVPSFVTFGQPDPGHPYVGTLLFVQNGEGYFSCTGTLLSPTLMLTAGHCTESEGNTNDVTYVRFTQDALAGLGNYPSVQAWLNAEWILAAQVIPHPQYDDFAAFPNTFDVGLVVLSQPVNLATYGALPPLGLLETLVGDHNRTNDVFTVVGYGLQGVINPFAGDDFARYKALVRLIELNSTRNGADHSAKFTNNPGRIAGGSCFGDSGGPIFQGSSNVIGAITSFGWTPCIGNNYNFRIDTPIAQDFILTHLN